MYKNLQPILYDLYTYNALTKYILTSGIYRIPPRAHSQQRYSSNNMYIVFIFSHWK